MTCSIECIENHHSDLQRPLRTKTWWWL